MAQAYGWTLDYIDGLSVYLVQRLGAASERMEVTRPGRD